MQANNAPGTHPAVRTEVSGDADRMKQITLYTVGHSAHTADAFIELLKSHAIDAICDVRSFPRSKWAPQHNREQIHATLKRAGIGYVWLGDVLGGRPTDARFYTSDGYVKYGAMAETVEYQRGLDRLERGAARMRVAIMCSEEDPTGCHRRLLIGKSSELLGWEILHIRGDGGIVTENRLSAEETQLHLFTVDEAWLSAKPVKNLR